MSFLVTYHTHHVLTKHKEELPNYFLYVYTGDVSELDQAWGDLFYSVKGLISYLYDLFLLTSSIVKCQLVRGLGQPCSNASA